MVRITEIKFRNILNSAGKISLEAQIMTNRHILAIASTPAAIIPGKREVLTTNNLKNEDLNELLEKICNVNIENQSIFDAILNDYMEKLGSNICLSLSLAFARVSAETEGISLAQYISKIANYKKKYISPKPLIAIFSGGIHDAKVKGSIQNIMLCVDIHPFSKSIRAITEIYTDVENELKKKGVLKEYGSSSGMIVEDMTTDEKFEMINEAIKRLKYQDKVSIAIDVAAEHFFDNGNYIYEGKTINSLELNEILTEYVRKYNVTYIEDPFDSNDEKAWINFKQNHPNIVTVGDDLFATQDKYINNELANGIIIKMNQVGTLTGAIKAFERAKIEKMATCVSHRSIETEDTFMCDLAVSLNADYIKIGGPRRGDRIAKYNRLLRLED